MVAGGLGSYSVLRFIESGAWNWQSHPRLARLTIRQRATLLLAVAAVAFLVAVVLLCEG